MSIRTLYLVRHGEADVWGRLTKVGVEQSQHVGARLAALGVDAVWHSPLPRAEQSARAVASRLGRVLVHEADELTDNVPYAAPHEELSPAWAGFFDGCSADEARSAERTAQALVDRFGHANADGQRNSHEVLVTHAYPISWMVRHALDAPPAAWMSMTGLANASLTVLRFVPHERPEVLMMNDLSHLPPVLRWTGFREPQP